MALKTALLVLSVVLAVQASDFDESDPLKQKLNNDVNSVCNTLLGVPCKNSPPPPPGVEPPPLEPIAPEPTEEPPLPPVPAPGRANGRIRIVTQTGLPTTPAAVDVYQQILQGIINGNGQISLRLAAKRRKLLQAENGVIFNVAEVLDCAQLLEALNGSIPQPFVDEGIQERQDIIDAVLEFFTCEGAGTADLVEESPPPPVIPVLPSLPPVGEPPLAEPPVVEPPVVEPPVVEPPVEPPTGP